MANTGSVTITIETDASQAIKEINQAKGAFQVFEGEIKSTSQRMFDQWKEHWFAFSAAAIAAYATISKAWGLAQHAAEYSEQINRLDAFARAYGTTADSVLGNLQRMSEGLISNKDLVKTATEAMMKAISPDKLSELAKYADAVGDSLGINAAEGFQRLADAASLGREKMIESIVGVIDLDTALGKQVKTMNDAEKAQARMTIMLERLKQLFPETGNATQSLNDKFDQFRATLENWKEVAGVIIVKIGAAFVNVFASIGAMANWGIGQILLGLSKLAGALSGIPIIGDTYERWSKSLSGVAEGFFEGSKEGERLAKQADEIFKNFGKVDNTTKAIIPNIKGMGSAGLEAAEKIKKLNEQIQDMIAKATLSPTELVMKQAQAYIAEGRNKVLVAKWAQTEIDKIEDKALKKRIADEIKYDEYMRGEAEKEIKRQEEKYRIIGELADKQKEMMRASVQGMWDMMMQGANMIGGEAGQGFGQAMSAYAEISGGLDPYAEKLRLLDEYYQTRLTKMYEAGANEQALMSELNAWDLQTTALTQMQKLNTYAQTANMIMGVMGVMGSFIKGHNTALFLLQKAAAIAITIVNTHAAAVAAVAPPPMGLGPVFGIPLAAKMMTFGYINAALIAATAIGEMAGGKNAGIAGIPAAGGYTYNQPTAPTWEKTMQVEEKKQAKTIIIHNHNKFEIGGNIVDHAAFVRELAPYLNEAQGDNVIIFE